MECPCDAYNEMFRLLMEYIDEKNDLKEKAERLLKRITKEAPQIPYNAPR